MIDAHHHVWDLSVRDQEWITGPEMAPLRRNFGVEDLPAAASGVTATVLVQTITTPEETPEFLALAEAHDLVAAVVGWTDLTAPSVADDLAALLAAPGAATCAASGTRCRARPTRAGSAATTYGAASRPSGGPDSSTSCSPSRTSCPPRSRP